MGLFILSCLSLFVLAFLTSLAVQAIRVEKAMTELGFFVEGRLTDLYQNGDDAEDVAGDETKQESEKRRP